MLTWKWNQKILNVPYHRLLLRYPANPPLTNQFFRTQSEIEQRISLKDFISLSVFPFNSFVGFFFFNCDNFSTPSFYPLFWSRSPFASAAIIRFWTSTFFKFYNEFPSIIFLCALSSIITGQWPTYSFFKDWVQWDNILCLCKDMGTPVLSPIRKDYR